MEILTASEFYTRVSEYMRGVDPTWEGDGWADRIADERRVLSTVLGEANGRAVLDCTCGPGTQAIPLATLGWQVTASDVTEAYLETARRRAEETRMRIDFRVCDLRDLASRQGREFDWVVSCMALDNLTDDGDILRALREMHHVLREGGGLYLRLRDFDNIMAERPRYEVHEERIVPHGRVIRLEDWEYESDSHVVCIYAFLREDTRKSGYRWRTEVFAYRRRALRKRELEALLLAAGFGRIEFLPQPSPWYPYEVRATGSGP